MPINPSALSSPEVESHPEDQTTTPIEESQQPDEQPRKRRTKKQIIEEAVVPAGAELVEVKDLNTGAKVQRPWSEALDLFRKGVVEFTDRGHDYPSPLKYAVMKLDQAAAAPAFETPAQPDAPGVEGSVPPLASLGDEVRVGSETYRVGHGGVLTSSPVADDNGEIVRPQRRWQRELGSGPQGPWESVALTHTDPPRPLFESKGQEPEESVEQTGDVPPAENGKGDVVDLVVQTEKLPHTFDEVTPGVIKLGTGALDKIGLPDYSSLQVGPITLSRMIQDDGRRTKTVVNGHDVTVITAAVEAFEELDDTVEFVLSRFRGQLKSFLQANGALKQPVS